MEIAAPRRLVENIFPPIEDWNRFLITVSRNVIKLDSVFVHRVP